MVDGMVDEIKPPGFSNLQLPSTIVHHRPGWFLMWVKLDAITFR